MTLPILLIAAAAFGATLLGGALALKLRDKLHLILGFSAGAVIAVAFFDLIPESLELGAPYFEPEALILWTAIGFFAYVLLDRFVLLHTHKEGEDDHGHHRGRIGAGTLSSHSLLDGIAVGLAFQASPSIGAVVAAAVLTHDFSDGINTVNLILKNGGTRKEAFRWLLVDAAAPVVGAVATLFFTLPASVLAIILALFAGFFLYLGASDLLPESHHAHPKALTTIMTIAGAVLLYGVIQIVG